MYSLICNPNVKNTIERLDIRIPDKFLFYEFNIHFLTNSCKRSSPSKMHPSFPINIFTRVMNINRSTTIKRTIYKDRAKDSTKLSSEPVGTRWNTTCSAILVPSSSLAHRGQLISQSFKWFSSVHPSAYATRRARAWHSIIRGHFHLPATQTAYG